MDFYGMYLDSKKILIHIQIHEEMLPKTTFKQPSYIVQPSKIILKISELLLVSCKYALRTGAKQITLSVSMRLCDMHF